MGLFGFGQKLSEKEKNIKKLLKKAKKLSKKGKFREACDICDEIINLDPNNYEALYLKGSSQIVDNYKEAIELFNRSLGAYPKSSDEISKFEYKILLTKVKLLNITGQFLEAANIIDHLLNAYFSDKIKPDNEILLAYAIALKGTGNYSLANLYFETAIVNITRKNFNSNRPRISSFLEANDSYLREIETMSPQIENSTPEINYGDLINDSTKLKEKDDYDLEDAKNFIIYGDQYKILNDYDKSIENYEIAIEILRYYYNSSKSNSSKSRNLKEALYNAIISKMNVEKIILNPDQLKSLDEAFELYPNKPDAWIIKSDWTLLTLHSTGHAFYKPELIEAIENYEKARVFDPKNPITPVKQAIITEYIPSIWDPKEDSYKLLNQATNLNPTYSYAFFLKGKKLLVPCLDQLEYKQSSLNDNIENLQQAKDCFQKVIDLNPNFELSKGSWIIPSIEGRAIELIKIIDGIISKKIVINHLSFWKIRAALGLPYSSYLIWDFSRLYQRDYFKVSFMTFYGVETIESAMNIGITTGFSRFSM